MRILLTVIFLFWMSIASAVADDYPQSYIDNTKSELDQVNTVDLSRIKPGQLLRMKWGGHPIYIYRRTTDEISSVVKADLDLLEDPSDSLITESIEKSYYSSVSGPWAQVYTHALKLNTLGNFRSLTKEYLVVEGIGPHSGCNLMFKAGNMRKGAVFFDPCSSTSFDFSGRIFKGIARKNSGDETAKYNLRLIPHHFSTPDTLIIGIKGGYATLPPYNFDHTILYEGRSPSDRLVIAARYNDHAMIHKALDEGASLYRPIFKGSILGAAIIGSSTDIVRLLIDRGVRPAPFDADTADMMGRNDVVKLIAIKEGAI